MNTLMKDNFTGTNHEGATANLPLKYLTASSIIGEKVYNNVDEHLGNIKDIMLDVATGEIDYFVIEFGGFLGIGVKYFALPFSKLHVDAERKIFIFSQSKEMLENAPGFDLEHWPDTNAHYEKVYEYWNFMG